MIDPMRKTISQETKNLIRKIKAMIDGVIRFLVLIAPTCIFIELIIRLRTVRKARRMMQIVNRSLKVISSKKISEHWKEKALLAYSRRIMGVTIVVFFGLLVALISASSVLALEWKLFVSSTPFMIFFDHNDVVLSSCFIALVYGWARTKVCERTLFHA